MAKQYDPETGLHILYKQPAENILFDMPLTERMRNGDTISSIVGGTATFTNMGKVPGSANISIGSTAFSGTIVQVRISEGQHGERYKITARITTMGGDTIEGDGMLYVNDL